MSILNIDWRVLLLQIGGFILLLLVFRRYLFGPIKQLLEDRRMEIADTYASANRERESMEQLRRNYEKRLEGIESEARERIQAAIKEAQGIRDDIVSEARSKAEAVLKRGEEELGRERDKTIVELRREVADLVIGASSKLLERAIDEPTHRKLIDDFISSAGEVK